jgi:peptidoglycan/LPS O-acetylase OafA/YrhL
MPLVRSLFLEFLAGMSLYQFRDTVRWRGWLAAVVTAAAAISCSRWEFNLILPLALPYVVLYLAHRLPFEKVEQWGDFSYGIYIYAFPIQQCLALANFQRFGFAAFLLTSVVLALVAGMASWFALERPVMEWARNLVRKHVATAPTVDTAPEFSV